MDKFRKSCGALAPYLIGPLCTWLLFSCVLLLARIDGRSMNPGLLDGDLIVCVRAAEPARSDIAVFRQDGELLAKRVIGLPGDTVRIEDGIVYLNGEPLDEPYILDPEDTGPDLAGAVTVPEGNLFVLGDNRGNSRDSRMASVGTVPMEDIIGTMAFRIGGGHV